MPYRLERLGKNATLFGTCLWSGKFTKIPITKILRVNLVKQDDSE